MLRLKDLKGSVIKPGLDTVGELLKRLGNPQLRFKSVHVAGTNGKGSVTTMLQGMLLRAGYTTAVYTSPHLHRFNERVTIDADEISDVDLDRLDAVVGDACEGIEPTYFEYTTAMAFLYFDERKPDVAIVEVGLGGRLDATNLVDSIVTVITPISMDHQEFLGETIEKIAAEKAGIMKPGVTCVVSRQYEAVMTIIEQRASEIGAPLLIEGRDFDADGGRYPFFDYQGPGMSLKELRCGLIGRHQLQNSAVALAAAEALIDKGFELDEDSIRGGVLSVKWPGRLELIDGDPPVLLDGTHNPGGARVLALALAEDFPGRSIRLIMGMQVTKDLDTFLDILSPLIVAVHAVPLRDVVYYDPAEIAKRAEARGIEGHVHPNVKDALRSASKAARGGGMILVAGSLYLVGEISEIMKEND